MNVTVVKRNGGIEDYDPEKIIRVVKAAGLNDEESQKLVSAVNTALEEKNRSQITSVQIRDIIIVEIQKINKEIADKFIWYEKIRDKNV
ncbi:hypothetical protein A2Z22_04170 [Candidatus Woesebacteria bacterium RBG_16_34_12]|uniref:ATP-cone domain-containing protein n=1 Tax=Candidatus Woesebacteria bacterium RBG_16_34_12 TaxID=1802480 RepID=A0A1F7X7U7_9BACT|nr:MAG: hypothetical protein A2Z22_04170 [Candidatus Woesebacteria bacterium RBG_16_34_12]